MLKRIGSFLKRSKNKVSLVIRRRPFTAFLASLLVLLVFLILGRVLTPPIKEAPQAEVIKDVRVLSIGERPEVKVAGKVKKDGLITITAQTFGVVQQIHFQEGQEVTPKQTLVSLSSNYQGGNSASLSRQIAATQYKNVKDSFDTEKEILQKQKEVAEKTSQNKEELRKIAASSNEDTKSLLSLNEQILDTINEKLKDLETNDPNNEIAKTREAKAQVQQGINSLRSAIRSADYSNNTSNPPTELNNLDKEITLKQLELKEKALVLNKEITQLNLSLAAVTEAMMFPVSPCQGVIQKVHVSPGQLVSPGTPLITVYAPSGNVSVVAKVPANIAKSVSYLENSQLMIGGQKVVGTPDFISTEATDGNLYQIVFNIPDYLHQSLTNNQFIEVELPIEQTTSGAFPFVPLDSIFQTQESAYLYLAEGDRVVSRKVVLGQVIGSDVEIKEGLKSKDKVILNRNVLAGDKVRVNE